MLPCLFGLFGPSFELRGKERKKKKEDNSPLLELLGFAATKNLPLGCRRSFRTQVFFLGDKVHAKSGGATQRAAGWVQLMHKPWPRRRSIKVAVVEETERRSPPS